MFAENGHDWNHLYSIVRENKHQAPKTENIDSNIVKLPWIPIIGPKIKKELWKTGCRVIFTSAAKLENILCHNKGKLLPNSYPAIYKLSVIVGRNTLEKQKNVSSLDQLNNMKIAWQEYGKRQVHLNIPKIVMGGLIGCTQKYLQNCPTYTNEK